MSTVALMISASPIASAPAKVAGAVVPMVGMAKNPTGTPASARIMAPSMPSLSWINGAMVKLQAKKVTACAVVSFPCNNSGDFDCIACGYFAHDRFALDVLDGIVIGCIQLVRGAVMPLSCALTIGQMKAMDGR